MKLYSQEKPIKQPDFGDLPPDWWTQGDCGRRKIAHEEVLRDMIKSPEHLLIDTHDESLNFSKRGTGQAILRTLARMASMQLKIQREQRLTNILLFIFALLAALFGGVQAWFTIWPRASIQTVPTLQSPHMSDQPHLLIPLAPIKPLELDVTLKKEEK